MAPSAQEWCEECWRLRLAYWNAIAEVAGLSRAAEIPAARLKVAEQAREAARDALMQHRIESDHR
jgi:hypothetical protein